MNEKKTEQENSIKPKKQKEEKIPKLFGIGKEKEYIAENIASLVSSGVSISSAISSVSSDLKNKRLKKILAFVVREIENGSPVWAAFQKSKLFSGHTIALLQIGEETGKLSENLKTISVQERKNREFKGKIRAASMYPAFVLALTLVVGVGIAWFVLPKLTGVFTSLALDLPGITKAIINFGVFLQNHGKTVIPAFFVFLILFFYFLFFFQKTKHLGQYVLLNMPGINTLIKQTELARFSFLFGTLLRAGLPMARTVHFLNKSTTFKPYIKFYKHIEKSILDGESFKMTFDKYKNADKIIPHSVQQIIFSAEQSGRLSEAFLEIGENAEAKAEYITKNIAVILEPVLLVIVWLGVVAVAVGVILPIYSLIGGVQR